MENKSVSNINGITKEQSKTLKGVAILFMVFHHLFLLSSIAPYEGLTYISPRFMAMLAYFCKTCVGIFAFLTGYSLYKSYSRISASLSSPLSFIKHALNYAVRHILSLYGMYWFSFIIMAPIEYVTNTNSHSLASIMDIFRNLLAINHMFPGSWNAAATYDGSVWYLPFYMTMLFVFPVIHLFFDMLASRNKTGHLKAIIANAGLSITILFIFITIILPSHDLASYAYAAKQLIMPSFAMVMLMGYVISRYGIYENINRILPGHSSLRFILALLALVLIFIVRSILSGDNPAYATLDFILVPVLILVLLTLTSFKYINLTLSFLGTYSTFMWFSHLHFVALFKPAILSFIHIPIIYYLIIVALSLIASIILTNITKAISHIFRKITTNKQE